MKLLKSFGEDDIEMKVVSLLDSTASVVSADTPWQYIATEVGVISWSLLQCAFLGSKRSLDTFYF